MRKNMKDEIGTFGRQSIAVLLSVALVPFAQWNLLAQESQEPYVPLDAEQLNQLVAPIALYPDSLVAQILTASTYPEQAMEADGWTRQNGGMRPEDRAAAADGMQWDPSVKALTAFPSVLENMARNNSWTTQLGSAYYNQPGDVMNAVQAMRIRAQEAGMLRTNRQYRVLYNSGLVVIEPFDPAYVYVPYYDPWSVYGGAIPMYRGWYSVPYPRGVVLGIGIGFGAAIGIGLWGHYGWGYHAWSPNWRGGVVVYNHNTYISNSRSVVGYGNFGGHNRGVYEYAGRGVPAGFHPPVTSGSAVFNRPGAGMNRPGNAGMNRPASGGFNRPGNAGMNRPASGGFNRPGNAGMNRPASGGFNRPGNAGMNRPASGGFNRPGNAGMNRPSNTGVNHPPSGMNRPSNTGMSRPGNNSPGSGGFNRSNNPGANRPSNAGGNPSGPGTFRGNGRVAQPMSRPQQPTVHQQPSGQSHQQGGQPHQQQGGQPHQQQGGQSHQGNTDRHK
jgi:Protein of unknown function (DUF3300)